jgi:hypothetical protein
VSVSLDEARSCWLIDTIRPDGVRARTRNEVACAGEERIGSKFGMILRLEGGKGLWFRDFWLPHDRIGGSQGDAKSTEARPPSFPSCKYTTPRLGSGSFGQEPEIFGQRLCPGFVTSNPNS